MRQKLLLFISGALCVCVRLKDTNEYLTGCVDQRFTTTLSLLGQNLWMDYEETEESDRAYYELQNSQYSYFCKSIYADTSYAGDWGMNWWS